MYEEVSDITISGFHEMNISKLTNAINEHLLAEEAKRAVKLDDDEVCIVIIECSYAVNLYSAILTYGFTKPMSDAG